jgi:exonuclease SbcD
MRILHTADWHLGRQLHNTKLIEDQAHILGELQALVRAERPDVVLIAGDVYDRTQPPGEAITLLDETLTRLAEAQVAVVAIAGNHDGPHWVTYGSRLMQERGVYIYGHLQRCVEPLIREDRYGRVAIYPLPYTEPPVFRSKLGDKTLKTHQDGVAWWRSEIERHHPRNTRSVGVAHLFVVGGEESESERPLAVGGADMVDASLLAGFDYMALGHLHRPQRAGAEHVRYAGSLLKYSFSEATHEKSVTLVEMDGAGACTVQQLPLTPRRDVCRVRGSFEHLLNELSMRLSKDDLLQVTLDDTVPVIDAMARLREVYENILHIEQPGLRGFGHVAGDNAASSGDDTAIDPTTARVDDLFGRFFLEMTGQTLSEEEQQVLAALLEQDDHDTRHQ